MFSPSTFVLYLLFMRIYASYLVPVTLSREYCTGSKNGMSIVGAEYKAKRLYNMFVNCTKLEGNLELVGLSLEDFNNTDNITSLNFLENITEVFGYVLIARNSIQRISLPKLKIIRNLYGGYMEGPEEPGKTPLDQYGLVITSNSQLKTVHLPNLRTVQFGGVAMRYNERLCHLPTIDWYQILGKRYSDTKNIMMENGRLCSGEEKCAANCSGHCWGATADDCQNMYRQGCAEQCPGMCFEPHNSNACCHQYCIAGCTGGRSSNCTACAKFENDDGSCMDECPKPKIYHHGDFKLVDNPDGRYAYRRSCVKKCPSNMNIYDGACVSKCPDNFHVPEEITTTGPHECVPCVKACEKSCEITGEQFISASNIQNLTNCTIINGKIEINVFSFTKHSYYDEAEGGPDLTRQIEALTMEDLDALKHVRKVTEYVHINTNERLTNLNFLSNLEVILGRRLLSKKWGMSIQGNAGLHNLGLKSLKKVHGSVLITHNYFLCYSDDIPWARLTTDRHRVLNNGNCALEMNSCSPECSGVQSCWGRGPDMCFECKKWNLDGVCVMSCPRGYVQAEGKKCFKCHPQCSECRDESARNCTVCKNVRLEGVCVEECPHTHYVGPENVCLPCHEACERHGCTGPYDTLNVGFFGSSRKGCKRCVNALLRDNLVEKCLKVPDDTQDTCGAQLNLTGYFATSFPDRAKVQGLACKECHPACKSCRGDGTKISQVSSNCKCKYYEGKESLDGSAEYCFENCTTDYYTAQHMIGERVGLCVKCHEQCKDGCVGPNSTDCNDCADLQDFFDENHPEKFNCTNVCPVERPFPDGKKCVVNNPAATIQKHKKVTVTVVAALLSILFFVLIATALFCFFQRRKNKTLKNLLFPPEIPMEPGSLNPDAKPNMARMKIIRETELRQGGLIGEGAFGAVYRGMYIPEEAHPAVKVPVAIKELSRWTRGAEEEMLEEAGLMASMDHRHLVRLVGVCISKKIMLVTPLMSLGNLLEYVQNNKPNIGSVALLTWATQIAEGMEYLEEHRLVHRDLAARNVLVQVPYHVRVADFGLAKMLDYGETEVHVEGRVPVKWLAIECIENRIFTHKSDVWAFGVTLWELLMFGAKPYANLRLDDLLRELNRGTRLPQPSICSMELYMLLIRCWMVDAYSRPSFRELKEKFRKMSKDPPQFLSVPNDKYMRLPSTSSQDDYPQMHRWREDFEEANGLEVGMDYFDNFPSSSSTTPSSSFSPTDIHKPLMSGSRPSRHASVGSHRYHSDPLKHLPVHQEMPGMENSDDAAPVPRGPSTDAANYLIPDSQLSAAPSPTPPTHTTSTHNPQLNYTPILTGKDGDRREDMYYNQLPCSSQGVDNLEYLQPNSQSREPGVTHLQEEVAQSETTV